VTTDFLTEYRGNTNRLASEIRLALTQGDLATVSAACHKLKSSSRAVGALSLGEFSHRMEQAARNRDVDLVHRLATDFEPEVGAVMFALTQALP
jgi:HPt (histidine-containing phosphotransfer) domain-containing protein